ncbi:hypothetical protein [Sciscionella sediminilitoris]|uniref:hypothetical protein n=1 Tax=Sciscionella sediminilitoris TaxID=1445613 RepID=UPI0004DF862B|nr:hypothetical protein [Sciscionella sp. SE31]
MHQHIPTVGDLAADPVLDRLDEMVNPPGLTNFLGAVQAEHDLTGLRGVNFPPLGHGPTSTALCYVDGRLFRSLGIPVEVRWRPDRVVRTAVFGDLRITSTTVCVPDTTAVAVHIEVANQGLTARTTRIGLRVFSTAVRNGGGVHSTFPGGTENSLAVDRERRAVLGSSAAAVAVQGLDTEPSRIDERITEVELTVQPGQSEAFGYLHVLADNETDALAGYDRLIADVPGLLDAAREQWDHALAAVFEPGNDLFDGHLPVLETDSPVLRRLYWTGILGVLYFRRDNPHSVLGRTFDTLMPRYWQSATFIWDYSLSSTVHALLEPNVMRRHLEHWITTDIHTHYGTEWLTGKPFGCWYSVNDYAMTRLTRDYVRWSGDTDWLSSTIATEQGGARRVADHMTEWARAWEGLRGSGELADYGGTDNLLECVSSYVHEVAGLNAANVWAMRAAAEARGLLGEQEEAERLRAAAAELVGAVSELYVDGGGYWNARQPDGSLLPVRHCYDFNTAGQAIGGDLPQRRRAEMIAFFERELRTPEWMRALSACDEDAAYSIRPDHQYNGAYTAWPAEAVAALCALGGAETAMEWLPGLAEACRWGPLAQGHLAEGDHAVKGLPQYPYLMDWACSSGGSFAGMVIQSVFGVDVGLDGEVSANPRLERFDEHARLRGLRIQGRVYEVDRDGIREQR